jgi:HAD superfamily hydrolase (TIGR01509 family)
MAFTLSSKPMKKAQRPAAVLFDMDGLLIDSEVTLKRIWQDEAARLGFDLNDSLYTHLVGVPNVLCEEMLVQWFKGFPLEEFRRAWKEARAEQHDNAGIPPKAGARELVAWLEGQGVPMALATSSSREAVERHRQNWPDLFRFASIMTVEQVDRPKPDPDIYLKTCLRLGAQPGDCVIFEDSNPGMCAAIASGARAIMIPDLVEPEPLVLTGAAHIYPTLNNALDNREDWF